jgi:hypothetical protein
VIRSLGAGLALGWLILAGISPAQEPAGAPPSPPPPDRPAMPVETPWGTVPLASLEPREGASPAFGPPDSLALAPPARDLPAMLPFGPGERLEFSVDYGIINAGGATMEIRGLRTVMGHPCLEIQTEARSNHFFSAFYKVWDRAQTFLEPETMLPWRFEKKLREGGYHKDVLVKYDRRQNFALYDNGDSVAIHPHVQDELSAFYFVRALDLEVGKDVYVDSHSGRKNYPLRVIVHGRETVEVPAGKFDCLVIEPVMAEDGIFTAKGTMTIYVTDDARRIPVLLKTKVVVGSIDVSLKDFELGKPFPRGERGDPTVATE